MKTKRPSLAGRAILAIVLLIGFYCLAISIVWGLLYILYAELVYAEQLHFQLTLICLFSASAILWSILPRFDRFEAPGPRLSVNGQPRLFRELTAIATAVHQAMPMEVYLVPAVNAWVSHRGGLMGFGSRRVMGLGLPLLKLLKTSEMRAVLAHEFGHYQGGDTALAPLIYKTRTAIIRTLINLGNGIVQKPFVWYGTMFLRITQAISRQQEYAADALAAQITGAQTLISGLQVTHRAGYAFDAFWHDEVTPLVSAGYRPPLVEGFSSFLEAKSVFRNTQAAFAKEMESPEIDPYQTHPALKDRIEALKSEPTHLPPDTDPAAIDLLEDLDGLEHEMLSILFKNAPATLANIRWEDSLETVYMPGWVKQCEQHAESLTGIHFGQLPEIIQTPVELIAHFKRNLGVNIPDAAKGSAVAEILAAAILVALHKKGCRIVCDIGYPVLARCGDIEIQPFSLIQHLFSGKTTKEDWEDLCDKTDLRDLDLGSIAGSPTPTESESDLLNPSGDEPAQVQLVVPSTPPAQELPACPHCGNHSNPAEYRPDAATWLCTACDQPLTKP